MDLRPLCLQERRVHRHQFLGAFDVTVADGTDDVNDLAGGKVDLENSAGFRDVDVWRRMIERVDPHLGPVLANESGHRGTFSKRLG